MTGTAARTEHGRHHVLVAALCFMVLFLEGYDITSMSYAIPSLVDAWHVKPPQFTTALTAGSFGLLFGALSAGLLGDRLGRKPVLIGCTAVFGAFSLLTAFSTGLVSLAVLRFCTGLGLGGGIPIAIALATDYALPRHPRRLVILMSAGISFGNTMGGFIASQIVKLAGWEAIFVVGGLLPMLVIPLLMLFMPESRTLHAADPAARRTTPMDLFRNGLAFRTSILWMVNFFNLVGNYFILFWLPAILHAKGLTPSAAILATTMYALGSIICALTMAPIVDRFGVERIVAGVLCMGALCVLLIGAFEMPFSVLCLVLCGAGIGIGGCQHGINSVSGALYPPAIRATGTGWALGVGRIGQIGGPLVGGSLLGLGWASRDIFLAASIPAACVAVGMALLGWLRHKHDRTVMAVVAGE
jgi:AAHS family 4-hydroxybenzoate transporter-like MFS transporter